MDGVAAKASKPVGILRLVFCYISMILLGFLVTIVQVICWPVAKLIDPTLFSYQRMVMWAAKLTVVPYAKVTVKGTENIPNGPCVIVCNHQSNLDSNFLCFALGNFNFKSLMKKELLMYPGVGSMLWMAGHIAVDRKDKDSGRKSLEKAKDYIKRGVSVLFYAEGTRHTDGDTGALGPFKPGAFIAARDAGVPILPITLSGCRFLAPAKSPVLNYGDVMVTVHKPIAPPPARTSPSGASSDAQKEREVQQVAEVTEATRATIATALRFPMDDLPARSKSSSAAEKKGE